MFAPYGLRSSRYPKTVSLMIFSDLKDVEQRGQVNGKVPVERLNEDNGRMKTVKKKKNGIP